MIEAKALNVDYDTLKFFANELDSQSKVKDFFYLETLIKPLGGSIIQVESKNLEHYNFVEVRAPEDFTVCIPSDLNAEMRRFILFQAFAHYILHAQKGKVPCVIKNMNQGLVAREAIIFTLCLLIPDDLMIKMIRDDFSISALSHFFRVPEQIIEVKQKFLNENMEKNNG